MEAGAEAFPIGFTRGIRSYWRSQKYRRGDDGGAARRGGARHMVRLGDGGGGGGGSWGVRLGGMFRARVKVAPATTAAVARVPARVLGRIRDAYVDVMLGVAKRNSAAAALSAQGGTEALWQKRVPVRRSRGQRQVRQKADELGQRLVMEMYKSVLASRDLSGMLQASTAR
ncbi:hypothetical protein GUJ93_ZPchr0001g32451 [Zizania palustris]|uniref:Uncharacterized protein n=1 Tax=Zizania palustris TaxID=103762 RepID=A0A8J5RWG3_ZIZPA|nr:hypothetical protein GUJ93_ZPchr0001g32451 [Zizania palustris]